MTAVTDTPFVPNDEVDETRWITAGRSRDTSVVRTRPPPGRGGRRRSVRRTRVTIYLVRHAKAGERNVWEGDDQLPPAVGSRSPAGARPSPGARRRAVRPNPFEPVRALHGNGGAAVGRTRHRDRAGRRARRRRHARRGARARAQARRRTAPCSARTATSSRCCLQHYAVHGVDIGVAPQWPKGSTWALDTDATGEVTARPVPSAAARLTLRRAAKPACGSPRPELRPLDSSSGPGTSRGAKRTEPTCPRRVR